MPVLRPAGQLDGAHLLRRLLDMLVHPAALQCSNAGAALFKDVVTLEHFSKKCVQLVRSADEFKHHAVRGKDR